MTGGSRRGWGRAQKTRCQMWPGVSEVKQMQLTSQHSISTFHSDPGQGAAVPRAGWEILGKN